MLFDTFTLILPNESLIIIFTKQTEVLDTKYNYRFTWLIVNSEKQLLHQVKIDSKMQ